tara:strand:- start:202 stop:438 length:237 start_codon:yes stop_codon:yes gene_type:complete
MTTKTIFGLAAASLFALTPAVHAQEVKTKDPVVSTQSLVVSPLLVAGGVIATTVVAVAVSNSGSGGGSSNNTTIFANR